MSDANTNLVSEKFLGFCRCLDIHHMVLSLYNHQSNGQADGMHQVCKMNYEEML